MKLGRKILLMLLAIFATTVVAAGIYLTTTYNYATGELSKTFRASKATSGNSKAIQQTKPITILLMGVDTGSKERKETWEGNSDTMILVTVNPKTKKTTMTSLERDLLTDIEGSGEAKLNSAYAEGGADLAISTIQKVLDIDIDYYALINMQGMIDLVDAVGGIEVTNHFDFPISIAENEPEFQAKVEPGTHKINGEQALIAINTGLDMQLTGLENINVKGALLGLSRKRIQEITEGVIEFAEIGDFLYQPVKKYSSGMKSRLGFSISLYLNPDIIIVDEALSVGDKGFAQKCLDKMNELKDQGKTIVFISHSLPQVRGFCQKAMWIEGGRLKEYGDVEEVCDEYAEYVDFYNSLKKKEKKKLNDEKFASRIVQNPKIGFWEKLLDKMKR